MKIEKLKENFQKISDPRRTEYGNIRHKLWEMLIIALCSVICMGEDYDDMEEFGIEREKWLKEELGLELEHGIPSGDTFRRLFERLKPTELRLSLNESLEYTRENRSVISIDGKSRKKAGIHVISAFVGENQLTLGELKSESKRGEIKEIPQLLDMVDVEGAIVTVDSIGCQHKIVEKLVSEKADYVLGLKKNQKNLHKAVEEYFMYNPTSGRCANQWVCEKNYGRVEQREYWLECELGWLAQRDEWAGLKSVGMVKSATTRNSKPSFEVRYFISSLTDVNEFEYAVRQHWGIENKLHWGLDMVFREDAALAKKDNAPLNLNILDKTALSLVSQVDLGKKLSKKRKRYKAALNPEVLLSTILCQK